jgi:hypothetical protein
MGGGKSPEKKVTSRVSSNTLEVDWTQQKSLFGLDIVLNE